MVYQNLSKTELGLLPDSIRSGTQSMSIAFFNQYAYVILGRNTEIDVGEDFDVDLENRTFVGDL